MATPRMMSGGACTGRTAWFETSASRACARSARAPVRKIELVINLKTAKALRFYASSARSSARRCVANRAHRSAPTCSEEESGPHAVAEPKFLLPVVVLPEPLLGRTSWPS